MDSQCCFEQGCPIESVSRVLGHTNIVTTQKYCKITTEKIDKDLTMFGDRLNQSFHEVSIDMERMIPSVNVGCQKWGSWSCSALPDTPSHHHSVIYEHERLCLATTRHDDVVTSVNWATFFLLQLSTSCIPKRL